MIDSKKKKNTGEPETTRSVSHKADGKSGELLELESADTSGHRKPTKDSPHGLESTSEQKRLESVSNKKNDFLNRKRLIQDSLKSLEGGKALNKKIKFETADEVENTGIPKKINVDHLLENSESEESDNDLLERFKGNKGKKFLELQSKFAADARFKLDARFHDDIVDSDVESKPPEQRENEDSDSESKVNFKLLENILGVKSKPLNPLKEPKFIGNNVPMLRYNPLKKSHKQYEGERKSEKLSPNKPSKNKESEKSPQKVQLSANMCPEDILKSKYYNVKDSIKESIKSSGSSNFSLLKTFGPVEREETVEESVTERTLPQKKKFIGNPFKYDDSSFVEETERVETDKEKEPPIVWSEKFFFSTDDPRLKETAHFSCGKDYSEKNFTEQRKNLKKIIQHKIKNNMTRKIFCSKRKAIFKRHMKNK